MHDAAARGRALEGVATRRGDAITGRGIISTTRMAAMTYTCRLYNEAQRSLLLFATLTIVCSASASATQTPARVRTRAADAPLVLDATTTILIGADEPGLSTILTGRGTP